jgi:hypothetical protein
MARRIRTPLPPPPLEADPVAWRCWADEPRAAGNTRELLRALRVAAGLERTPKLVLTGFSDLVWGWRTFYGSQPPPWAGWQWAVSADGYMPAWWLPKTAEKHHAKFGNPPRNSYYPPPRPVPTTPADFPGLWEAAPWLVKAFFSKVASTVPPICPDCCTRHVHVHGREYRDTCLPCWRWWKYREPKPEMTCNTSA